MKSFKSLKKVYEFFEKRLNKLINNTSDRVRLPCPYSRLSELILIERCMSFRGKNVVKKLDDLYQRHDKLIKQIKQENMDFKAIVARQGRELVSGKVRNIRVLYESEIYLLTMSVSHAQFQALNHQKSVEEIENENEKLNYFYTNYCQKPDLTDLKSIVRDIKGLQTECELIESEINEIESRLSNGDDDNNINSDGNTNDDNNINNVDNNIKYKNSNDNDDNERPSTSTNKHDSEDDANYLDDLVKETKNLIEDDSQESVEAKTNIAALKALPWLVHNIFNKLVNE